MDTNRLAELLKGAKEDYSQLADAYPNAAKFVNALRGNIEQNVPTQADFKNPQAMADWSQSAALNAPMGLAIKASHGSPHKFKKFDLEHLGTGEGAQMYGHGLYFGEGYGSPVAMRYAPRSEELENKLLALQDLAERRQQYPAMEVYEQYMLNKTPENIEKYFADELPDYPKSEQMQINNALNIARDAYQKQKGSYLYDVDLKWPDPAREASDPLGVHHLLDWDKPLSEQPHVQKAILNSEISPEIQAGAGADLYSLLGGGEAASKKLLDMGIPGLKYLDQDSRGFGEGAQNMVMFSDKSPDIVSINSKAVAKKLKGK